MLLTELLEEFKFHCGCRRLSPKTIDNYRKQVEYLIRYLDNTHSIIDLEDVEPHHIKAFIMMKYDAGCKPAYINDLLKAFKVYFKYAFEEEYTDRCITEKIKNMKQPKTVIRTFSRQEIRRMLACYTGYDFLSIRNRTILTIFFDTGIRLSELLQLKDSDIKTDHILIHGKGDKERVVPKSPVVSKWLQKYMRVRNHHFETEQFPTVFVNRYKSEISKSMLDKIIKDAGAFAEVNGDIRISAHTLRHTFCQQQLRNGLDIYSLSRIMGHENISITQRYLEGMRDREILETAKHTSTIMNL